MKALVIGATGAVGRDLIALLLKDPSFDSVEIFVRRAPDITDPKLVVHKVDFDKIDEWKELVSGDIAFSCLGTTLKVAGSQEAQYKVDYTYQYNFAKVASDNNVQSYFLVSSSGANAKSPIFYSKMKGELDDAVQELKFKHLSILRPPALIRENTDRVSEKISLPIIKFFNKLGILKSQTPMETMTVAKAMVNLSKINIDKTIINPSEIRYYAG